MAVTDPGFSTRGDQSRGLGQKPIIWQDYCKKMHGTERNWVRQCLLLLFTNIEFITIFI